MYCKGTIPDFLFQYYQFMNMSMAQVPRTSRVISENARAAVQRRRNLRPRVERQYNFDDSDNEQPDDVLPVAQDRDDLYYNNFDVNDLPENENVLPGGQQTNRNANTTPNTHTPGPSNANENANLPPQQAVPATPQERIAETVDQVVREAMAGQQNEPNPENDWQRGYRAHKPAEYMPELTHSWMDGFLEWSALRKFLFVVDDSMDIWIRETNRRGPQLFERWKETDRAEMLLFLASFMARGLVKTKGQRAAHSNDEIEGNPFISSLLSRDRWLRLLRASHFVNKQEAFDSGVGDPQSPNYDRLHKIRNFMDASIMKWQLLHDPDVALSLDESMCKCKGAYKWICVFPNKPISKGIKLFVLSCATCACFLNIIPYCASEFDDTEDLGATGGAVIAILRSENLFGAGVNYLYKGHKVYFDNYYTMIRLLHVLITKYKTYAMGMLRMSRGVPGELSNKFSWVNYKPNGEPKEMERGECKVMSKGTVSICHWKDGGKCIMAWNFVDVSDEVTEVTRKYKDANGSWCQDDGVLCPKPVNLYNGGMGAVDLGNQICASGTCHIKCHRWYMTLVWKVIDFDCVVAYIAQKQTTKGLGYREFRKAIIYGCRDMSISIGRGPRRLPPPGAAKPNELVELPTIPKQKPLNLREHRPMQKHKYKLLTGTSIEIRKLRRDGHPGHVLVKSDMGICHCHSQRVRTTWMCNRCKLSLCPGICDTRFHNEDDYVWYEKARGGKKMRSKSTC